MEEKICCKCGIRGSADQFMKSKRTNMCLVCKRAYDREYYKINKQRRKAVRDRNTAVRKEATLYILKYLEEHPCIDCGETNPVVLDFDHRENKDRTIASLMGYSLSRLKKEINKCDVRCANCHRIRHAKENNTLKIQILSSRSTTDSAHVS